jgi:hypothetical protein
MIRGEVMPQGTWNAKRERQYEHIKDSAEDRGASAGTAKRIAAATVNKERARHHESATASRESLTDVSSGHRGGKRSHTGAAGRTRDQLYAEAKRRNIKGRSKMSKSQLERAVGGN